MIRDAGKGKFQAHPLFRAPRDTVAAGPGRTLEELTAQMRTIQHAAPRRPDGSPG